MQKRSASTGPPPGTTTYEAEPALAFGQAVRGAARLAQGVAQDEFASTAGIARSHTGKIERGEHMPTFASITRNLRCPQHKCGRADERNGTQSSCRCPILSGAVLLRQSVARRVPEAVDKSHQAKPIGSPLSSRKQVGGDHGCIQRQWTDHHVRSLAYWNLRSPS